MAGRIGGTPRSKFSVAILSGARRMGRWVVPANYVGVAVMGGIELDLREAQFSEPEVTIHAYTVMGGIEITVPEDVDVDVSGVAFMGGFDHNASGPGVPGAPRVRVIGFACMGGVDVQRKPPKKELTSAEGKPG
jgi:hydrogenase/urease accessory protein HupE